MMSQQKNTKALVYGANSRGESGSCPRLWHNGHYSRTGHLWVFLSHKGWWQVNRGDFNIIGDDGQRTSFLLNFHPSSLHPRNICPMWLSEGCRERSVWAQRGGQQNLMFSVGRLTWLSSLSLLNRRQWDRRVLLDWVLKQGNESAFLHSWLPCP